MQITLACRNSDGTNALIRGLVKPSGFDLRVVEMNNVVEMFTRTFRGEFDVAEMSLAEFVYYFSRKKVDFIGIPVFPSRMFRHRFIYHNTSAGVHRPELLLGKKIGFLRWVQTAFVWIRGILVDDYNISPSDTQWYVNAIHHWHDSEAKDDIEPRDGTLIRRLNVQGKDEYKSICRALSEGILDALVVTENPRYAKLLDNDKRVARLFPEPREAEMAYFQKSRILPIMHVLVARKTLLEKSPNMAAELFRLFSESKKIGREWVKTVPSLSLAWKNDYLEDESRFFSADAWAYGLEENRQTLTAFLSYCYAQGVSTRRIDPNELFTPETWALTEQP